MKRRGVRHAEIEAKILGFLGCAGADREWTVQEVAARLPDVSTHTTSRILSDMDSRGLVRRVGVGRATRWVLARSQR